MDYEFMLVKNKYKFSYKQRMLVINENTMKNLKEEISILLKEFTLYNISLKKLTHSLPNPETKDLILNVAYAIINQESIYKYIKKNRLLPVKKISNFITESITFVEKWKYYILAYIIIISNNSYANIQAYLNIDSVDIEPTTENNLIKTPDLTYDKNTYTGILLKHHKNSGFILSSYGDFINIKLENSEEQSSVIGGLATGDKKKSLKIYKYPILASVFSLMLIFLVMISFYNQPYATIILESNFSLKIETNRFNKIISVTPNNSSGKKLLSVMDPKKKDINFVLEEVLIKAKKQEFIKEHSTLFLYINGSSLQKKDLQSTEKFVMENKIDARINNNGVEYTLNKK